MYAKSVGKLLFTKEELQAILTTYPSNYIFSGTHWAAVRGYDGSSDWVQVGSNSPGASYQE